MKTLELEKMGVEELSSVEARKIEGGNPLYLLMKAVEAMIDYFYPETHGPSPWAGCEEPPY
jgi:hypothetical protein